MVCTQNILQRCMYYSLSLHLEILGIQKLGPNGKSCHWGHVVGDDVGPQLLSLSLHFLAMR